MQTFSTAWGMFTVRAVLTLAVALGVGAGAAQYMWSRAARTIEFSDGEFRPGFVGEFTAFVVAREPGHDGARLVGAGLWRQFLAEGPGRTLIVSGAGEFDESEEERFLYGSWSSSPGESDRSLMRVVAHDGDSTTTTRYYATEDAVHLVSVEFIHGMAVVAGVLAALLAGVIAGLVAWVLTARWAKPILPGRRRPS